MEESEHDHWEWVPGTEELDDKRLLDDLGLIAELNHPMRSSILRALRTPRTVGEVAERLDMPITRLYHHFNRLEAGQLIRVVATRKAGAATERRYQVAAKTFELAPELLESSDRRELAVALGSIFDTTKLAFQREVEDGTLAGDDFGDLAVLSLGGLNLSPARYSELMDHLEATIREFASDVDEDDPNSRRALLFMAAFPESG